MIAGAIVLWLWYVRWSGLVMRCHSDALAGSCEGRARAVERLVVYTVGYPAGIVGAITEVTDTVKIQ